MDYEAMYHSFVHACSLFQEPASRLSGERMLLQFRSTPAILPVTRYILDHATHPLVLFEAASAMKECLATEFSNHSQPEINALRTYLINIVVSRGEALPNYVREQLLHVAALLAKRGWLQATTQDREAVISHAVDLLQGSVFEKKLAMSLLRELISEFSIGKASALGLPRSYHYQCKLSFEQLELQHIFQMVFRALFSSIPHDASQVASFDVSTDTGSLSVNAVSIAEAILNWEFTETDKSMNGAFDSTIPSFTTSNNDADQDAFRNEISVFPESWSASLARPDLLHLFFLAYRALSKDHIAANKTRQCLIQLASLHARLFPDENAQKVYASQFLHGLMQLLQACLARSATPDIDDHAGPELRGCVQMAKRLLMRFSIPVLASSPDFVRFLEDLASLTQLCLTHTAPNTDNTWYSESADELLETWAAFVLDAQQMTGIATFTHFLQNQSSSIFTTFVDCKMATARLVAKEEKDIHEDDFGLKDREMYSDQLISVATLARNSARQSIWKIMAELTTRLDWMRNMQAMPQKPKVLEGRPYAENLSTIHEQVHWLTLLSGYILADSGQGEQPLVPPCLATLSNESISIDADPIIQFPNLIFGFLKYVTVDPNQPQAESCSPLVAESLLWFVERWCRTYLFLIDSEQEPKCPGIVATFGANSNGAQALDFFLEILYGNLLLWVADPDVTSQIVKSIMSLAKNKLTRQSLLKSAKFQNIVTFTLDNLHRIPAIVHTALIQTIATIASHAATEETRLEYFTGLDEAIQKRLVSVLNLPNLLQIYNRPEVKFQVMNTLELYTGLALSQDVSTTPIVWAACSPYLNALVHLLELYHNVPEVEVHVLRFFEALVRNAEFSVLGIKEVETLLGVMSNLFTAFEKTGIGKSRSNEVGQEDELFEDVSSLLRLMSALLESGSPDGAESETRSQIGNIVFYGVNTVIPLLSAEMLKFPALRGEYVPLVTRLVQYYPHRLVTLPPHLLSSLIRSLVYGFDSTEYEISRSAFEAAMALAMWVHGVDARCQGTVADANIRAHLDVLLSEILSCLLFKEFDPDLIHPAGEALFALALCRHTTYSEYITRLLDSKKAEHAIHTRLSNAFNTLNHAISSAIHDGGVPPGSSGTILVSSSTGIFLKGPAFASVFLVVSHDTSPSLVYV
ncbi:hypothetical protein SeLEV6574_g06845 [Synchytrium endobioticum]|uniref:Exportin-4 n=1 Tax=Synchytrium endobioticum TaxID=286115 RepID=A0A507CG08_9FUNG|nr:hypothetical protein SeLEV6574_g06845 [Synchytrium endobioticum]